MDNKELSGKIVCVFPEEGSGTKVTIEIDEGDGRPIKEETILFQNKRVIDFERGKYIGVFCSEEGTGNYISREIEINLL
ncbi:MAG: hypothetical protein ABIA78_02840 [archaeon]